MSTVLWANYLLDGHVTSDEADKYALYKYSIKLDRLTRQLGVTPFLQAQDTTDAKFNVSDEELPQGMESTDELMAEKGAWIESEDAIAMLETLVAEIKARNIRFGAFSNAQQDVLADLDESLKFAKEAASRSAKFNFSVVM